MTTTFEIIDGDFLVYASDGSGVFDSRMPLQGLHLIGVIDVPGRRLTPNGGGGFDTNPAYTVPIALAKTFPSAPYVRAFSRRIYSVNNASMQKSADRIYPQHLNYNGNLNYLNYLAGFFTTATPTTLYISNCDSYDILNSAWDGARRVWYSVFENTIG